MVNCYCAICFLLKCPVACELLKDKQQFKFGVVMRIHHCIKSVEEIYQNKSKRSKNKEERPKNKEKIFKCEEHGFSENSGEKGAKV